MSKDGKKLEQLVAFVEEVLCPEGFTVETNEKIYDDDGHQLAEFDIILRGKVRTSEFSWLIECRDRPSQGAAPGNWIEQLEGRRRRFKFDRVTAVSTTGFAPAAIDAANKADIELREVSAIDPKDFEDWIKLKHITFSTRLHNLKIARVTLDENLPDDVRQEVQKVLEATKNDKAILRAISTGAYHTFSDAFIAAVSMHPNLFDGVIPNETTKDVKIHARYVNKDDYFEIETTKGSVRIFGIHFQGELSEEVSQVPISAAEYSSTQGEAISQLAAAEVALADKNLSIEMHKIPESEHIHLLARTSKKQEE